MLKLSICHIIIILYWKLQFLMELTPFGCSPAMSNILQLLYFHFQFSKSFARCKCTLHTAHYSRYHVCTIYHFPAATTETTATNYCEMLLVMSARCVVYERARCVSQKYDRIFKDCFRWQRCALEICSTFPTLRSRVLLHTERKMNRIDFKCCCYRVGSHQNQTREQQMLCRFSRDSHDFEMHNGLLLGLTWLFFHRIVSNLARIEPLKCWVDSFIEMEVSTHLTCGHCNRRKLYSSLSPLKMQYVFSRVAFGEMFVDANVAVTVSAAYVSTCITIGTTENKSNTEFTWLLWLRLKSHYTLHAENVNCVCRPGAWFFFVSFHFVLLHLVTIHCESSILLSPLQNEIT